MSIAETAQLAVNLKLGTTGSFAGATSQLKNVEAAAVGAQTRGLGTLESGMLRAKTAAGSFGTALGHAKNQIGGMIGSLGILGGVTGLIGVSAALGQSIEKASEFAFAIEKLQGITGESADSLARLIAVTDNYGISADRLVKVAGFTEKALGLIAQTADSAAKFTDAYGFTITDAKGKVLGFQAVLLKVADYYNSNASQSQKAALAAKLFGRNYSDLVPILKLGSKGIKEAEQAAADLGITLTATNVQDLVKFREATRDMDDALTGLKLQIGLGIVPALTDLAKVTKSFVAENRDKIVSFFKDGVKFARDMGAVVEHSVIPAIKGIASAWGSIPPEIRDLLVKGFVANKVIKFAFGFSPISFAKDALGGLVKGLFQRGGTPANPLFVADVTGGLGKGIGALPGVAAGGAAAAALPLAVIAASIAGPIVAQQKISSDQQIIAYNLVTTNVQQEIRSGIGDLNRALDGVNQGIHDIESNPLNMIVGGQALEELKANRAALLHQIGLQTDSRSETAATRRAIEAQYEQDKSSDTRAEAMRTRQLAALSGIGSAVKSVPDALHAAFRTDFAALLHATKAPDVSAAARKVAAGITKGVGNIDTTRDVIAELKRQLGNTHDPKLQATLRTALAAVTAKLPGREFAAREFALISGILKDGKITSSESAKANAIMRALKDRGLPHAADAIRRKIDEAKRAQVTAAARTTQAVKDKDLSVVANTTVNVSTRTIAAATATSQRIYTTITRV